MKNFWIRLVKLGLICLGILLLFLILRATDWSALEVYFKQIIQWGWLVFLIYPLTCIWDIWGWKMLLPPTDRARVTSWQLFWIRLSGEAINNVTPFIDIGGEYLKIIRCAEAARISKAKAAASIILTRSVLFYSEVLFWLFGITLCIFVLHFNQTFYQPLVYTALIGIVLVALLIWSQQNGFLTKVAEYFEKINSNLSILKKAQVSLQETDREMRELYTKRLGDFWLSLILHFIGWIFGGLEIYLMLLTLGHPIPILYAIILEALLQLVKTSTFFIPGNIGTQEGYFTLSMQLLHLNPTLGLALSLYKRLRYALWTFIGFLLILKPHHKN